MNSSPEEALFALALTKPAEKRAAFLDAMCEGDAASRQRLEALLAAHEQPETLLATRVALKVIKLGMDTKQVVARFEAERQALAMMDHPNIDKVLRGADADTAIRGRPWPSMASECAAFQVSQKIQQLILIERVQKAGGHG